MAGFSSLGGNSYGSVGNISGQAGSYGIQPPTASYAPSSATLGGGLARSAPSNPAAFYQNQAASGLGADNSSQHSENIAMQQAGFGNLGMQGYRGNYNNGVYSGGFDPQGQAPGTSYSNYGLSAPGYADLSAYMSNPLGPWQLPQGTNADTYGQAGFNGITNSNRYQMMMDSIKGSLTGMWPQASLNMAAQYGANGPNGYGNILASAPQGYTTNQINTMAGDILQQFGSAFNTLPPPAAQMVNIAPSSLAGVRSF